MPGLLDLIAARNPEQAGGLLSDLVAAPRNRLRGLLDNPIGFANDALQEGLFGPPEVRAARDKFWNKEPMTDLEKQAYTNQLLNIGMAGLTVYHGSPHKFDKFDMSKIGTGEGAQAYGHGLYFAESPDVANSYVQSVVANSDELAKRGASHGLPADVASNLIAAKQSGKNFDAMIDAAKKAADNPLLPQSQKLAARRLVDHEMQAYNAWSDWSKPGSLYKVDLPDEAVARMLDWDKPLSQQAPEVQKAFEAINAKLPFGIAKATPETSGKKLHDIAMWANEKPSSASVNETLRQYGIPGIRYLDGGSRNAGQGTYNYVVFDDTLPTILERNGQKLK